VYFIVIKDLFIYNKRNATHFITTIIWNR